MAKSFDGFHEPTRMKRPDGRSCGSRKGSAAAKFAAKTHRRSRMQDKTNSRLPRAGLSPARLPVLTATPRYRTRLGQNSIVGAGAGLLVVEAGCTGRLLPTRLGPSHYRTDSTHSPAGGREFATVPVAPVHERQLMIAESTLTASPLTRPVDRFGGERPLRRRWPARELAPGPAGRPVCCRIAVAPGPDAARL